MVSQVYFTNFAGTRGDGVLDKLDRLCVTAGLEGIIARDDLVAVKLHFGELGNTRMLRPQFVKTIVKRIKKSDAQPFLTDCNTLFYRHRYNAVHHLDTAAFNGYDHSIGAPVIVADGLRGLDYTVVKAADGMLEVKVGSAIYQADKLVVVTHFKGHDDVGFGGIIKNLGMGAVARAGKQAIHSHLKPTIDPEICNCCERCMEYCPDQAIIRIADRVLIAEERCTNCGHCLVVCPQKAIPINWERGDLDMQRKLVESCAAVLKNKKKKTFFISFLVDITHVCDCRSWSPLPLVPDIGILAGTDLLAVEQASLDLVQEAVNKVHPGCSLWDYAGANGEYMLDYAEKIGLGSRKYELIMD